MSGLQNIINKIDWLLVLIIKPIVIFISLAVAFMLSYGIFSRAVLDTPVFGLEELILMGAMWLYMLGAALASRDRSHLSADFIQVISSNVKVVNMARIVATLISLFMAIMFASWSFDLMTWAVEKGQSTTVFQLPWYLSQSSLFIASVLFIFYLIRDVCDDVSEYKKTAN